MKRPKQFVLSSLYKLKYFDLLRHFQKNRVIILMYHRFSDKPEPFKVSKAVFENQIKFLRKRYIFISLKHYSEILNGKRNDWPNNPIILTIDDGYWDNYAFAYPVLKKYSIPASIFITTDFVSRKRWIWFNKLEFILKNSKINEFDFPLGDRIVRFRVDSFDDWHTTQLKIFYYCRKIGGNKINELLAELANLLRVEVPGEALGDYKPLNWDQIREMYRNGIDFGAHTHSHPILPVLSRKEARCEIMGSKEEVEKELDSAVVSFSYPDGKVDGRIYDLVRSGGFSCAVTTEPGFNNLVGADSFLLKRISINKDKKGYLLRQTTR